MRRGRSSRRGGGNGDTLWGGVAICLFMAVFTFGMTRQGGINFGAVAAVAMFWIVGISMLVMGIMKRRGTYDKTKIKDFAPKVIITTFGACMASIGVWLDVGMVREELFVKHNGWSMALVAELAFASLFAVVGSLCFFVGACGLFARRRNAVRDQQTAQAYLDYPLKRTMAQKVRGTVTFAVVWCVGISIFASVFWSKAPSAWSLMPLAPFVGVGVFLIVKSWHGLVRHRACVCHRVRLNAMALYPGGEVSVSYEALGGKSGGTMCAVVTQLDASIREMRESESTDITADKSAKQVVAKQLAFERGQFSFRLPKALYAERIRWELVLRFHTTGGEFVEEHFKLPLR